jgi:hypothetical protein
VVDRLGHALSIDWQRRRELSRQPLHEACVLRGRVGQQLLNAGTM